MADCRACDGTGECQNDHHNSMGAAIDLLSGGFASSNCPACGQGESVPGKCSACGGTGDDGDD